MNLETKAYKGQKPTPRDEFFKQWGLELVKNQFNMVSELLKQQISLTTALLGASAIFEDFLSDHPKIKALVIIAFLIGLIAAFVGIMPFERKKIWLDSPTEIDRFQRDALAHKKVCYMTSGVCIMVGFILVLFSLL